MFFLGHARNKIAINDNRLIAKRVPATKESVARFREHIAPWKLAMQALLQTEYFPSKLAVLTRRNISGKPCMDVG